MNDWTELQRTLESFQAAGTIAMNYTVPAETAEELKRAAPIYGSKGQALQVATEVLIRMERPPELKGTFWGRPAASVRISLRLHKRTFELIRKMAKLEYNDDPGLVITACVRILNSKRLHLGPLSIAQEDRIEALTAEFDSLLTRMQTKAARGAMQAAFHAKPGQLGRAALKAARKRG